MYLNCHSVRMEQYQTNVHQSEKLQSPESPESLYKGPEILEIDE